MTATHTPGPWRAMSVSTAGAFGSRSVYGPNTAHVAEVWNGGTRDPEVAAANARLIAAAPDLLAVVATMLGAAEADALDDKSNVWRSAMLDARAALAKVQS
jgi:hypothetical protein